MDMAKENEGSGVSEVSSQLSWIQVLAEVSFTMDSVFQEAVDWRKRRYEICSNSVLMIGYRWN